MLASVGTIADAITMLGRRKRVPPKRLDDEEPPEEHQQKDVKPKPTEGQMQNGATDMDAGPMSRATKKIKVEVRHKGERHFLGTFDSKADADGARERFRQNPQKYLQEKEEERKQMQAAQSNGHWDSVREKYKVEVRYEGKDHFLGRFDTKADADRERERFRQNPQKYLQEKEERKQMLAAEDWTKPRQVSVTFEGNRVWLGTFDSKADADRERERFRQNPQKYLQEKEERKQMLAAEDWTKPRQVNVTFEGKQISLGTFDSKADADRERERFRQNPQKYLQEKEERKQEKEQEKEKRLQEKEQEKEKRLQEKEEKQKKTRSQEQAQRLAKLDNGLEANRHGLNVHGYGSSLETMRRNGFTLEKPLEAEGKRGMLLHLRDRALKPHVPQPAPTSDLQSWAEQQTEELLTTVGVEKHEPLYAVLFAYPMLALVGCRPRRTPLALL